MTEQVDIISYVGEVSGSGYAALCRTLREKKKASRCIVMLATPGGDANAGFRIARALQHSYTVFEALVPRYCKSAGTLIVTGASHVYMDDMSELGPLDVQIKKGDEVLGRNSGLDLIQAVNYLQVQALNAFEDYLIELTTEIGLSTRVASDIATKLTSGIFGPIAGQIDPMKLAEMQRATEIASQYGTRLAAKGGNLKKGAVARLVSTYPSHGFVIDRKEARSLFINVDPPPPGLLKLGRGWNKLIELKINSSPEVDLQTVDLEPLITEMERQDDTNTPDAGSGKGSAEAGVEELNGIRSTDSQGPSGDSSVESSLE